MNCSRREMLEARNVGGKKCSITANEEGRWFL